MLLKVKFSHRAIADGKLMALLDQNGWEADLILGEDDVGCWYQVGVAQDDKDPRVVARTLTSPFLAIHHSPLEMRTEVIPPSVRLNAIAQELSRYDLERAQQAYALADEFRTAGA